jgi:hypothetical protein
MAEERRRAKLEAKLNRALSELHDLRANRPRRPHRPMGPLVHPGYPYLWPGAQG